MLMKNFVIRSGRTLLQTRHTWFLCIIWVAMIALAPTPGTAVEPQEEAGAGVVLNPEADLSVRFSTEHESGSDAGHIVGTIINRSRHTYACAHVEFKLLTRFDARAAGEKAKLIGTLGTDVKDIPPGSGTDFRVRLPSPAGVAFGSVGLCQEVAKESAERDRKNEAQARNDRSRTNVRVPARRGQPRVRDHRSGAKVRDHRSGTRVRDHRSGAKVRDHRSGTRVRDHRPEVKVRDHRGKVDVWDAGVSVRKPGERRKDDRFSDDKADSALALQPPAELPRAEVRSWLERYKRDLGALVRRAWSREEADGFFADENRHCEGNLYCQLSARQQAISLAVSRR